MFSYFSKSPNDITRNEITRMQFKQQLANPIYVKPDKNHKQKQQIYYI